MKTFSHCCEAKIILGDICNSCKEHCQEIEVDECCDCHRECFSDTWTMGPDGNLCEECAAKWSTKRSVNNETA